ncbi:MAG: hypothetical protein ACI8Z1_001532 [Candidatus Azotimanducaceae bacterium]|jgi:hypothetical protein
MSASEQARGPTLDITLLSFNIDILEQFRQSICALSEDQNNWGFNGAHSSVGKHTLQIIDDYLCFLSGIPSRTETGSGLLEIHYDQRPRDEDIETSRFSAINALLDCEQRLCNLSLNTRQLSLSVYMSTHIEAPAVATDSSVERELVFL